MTARVDKTVISGVFSLDGQDFDVDNNVWLVGDDDEVLVIDAPHHAEPILQAIGRRSVTAIVLTHGHVHPSALPDRPLGHCTAFDVAGTQLVSVHTPGHSPGSTSLYARGLTTVFTGDTPFCGGPGATGRSHSDEPTILRSIRSRLMTLPGDTVVRTGHGADTTIVAVVCHVG